MHMECHGDAVTPHENSNNVHPLMMDNIWHSHGIVNGSAACHGNPVAYNKDTVMGLGLGLDFGLRIALGLGLGLGVS